MIRQSSSCSTCIQRIEVAFPDLPAASNRFSHPQICTDLTNSLKTFLQCFEVASFLNSQKRICPNATGKSYTGWVKKNNNNRFLQIFRERLFIFQTTSFNLLFAKSEDVSSENSANLLLGGVRASRQRLLWSAGSLISNQFFIQPCSLISTWVTWLLNACEKLYFYCFTFGEVIPNYHRVFIFETHYNCWSCLMRLHKMV